jgi:hypothetical protein
VAAQQQDCRCRGWHSSFVSFIGADSIFYRKRCETATSLLAAVLCALLIGGCASPSNETAYAKLYDKPIISPGAQFASLPPAVQNTIRAQTGSAGVQNISKDTSAARIVYRIEFINADAYPPMYVAADGSLLDPDLNVLIAAPHENVSVATGAPVTTLMLGELPPPVVKSIQLHAPDAEVANIIKEAHGDQTTYYITFKDRMHAPLHLAADGTPLPDSAR